MISLASWRVASSIEGEAASRPEPLPAAQPVTRPMRITATGDAEIAARALIAWCGYDGNTALWRAGLDVEVVDIGGGRFNIGINHDEKTRLLDGNVLWYMAELRKGKLYAVTPSKRASAQACRALDETPMADGLRVIVR